MRFLFVLLCILQFAFTFELNFDKKFAVEIVPDILVSYISVSTTNKDEAKINQEIELFNEYIEDNIDIRKENGSFNLTPRYIYKNNKQIFIGYTGTLRYTIKSKDAVTIKTFFSEFMEIKNKLNSKDVKINISQTSWTISSKLYDNSLDKLRLKAIEWIANYSLGLHKQCLVKSIYINRDNKYKNISYSRSNNSRIMFASTAPVPTQSKKQITIIPNYTLECK